MAESIREQIVQNWLITMQTISVANGYLNDLDIVDRVRLPYNDQGGHKVLLIKQGDEFDGEGNTTEKTRALGIDVIIQLRPKSLEDSIAIDQLMNSVETDIFQASQVDRTRGGLAYETVREATGGLELDEAGTQAEKVIRYTVWYRMNHFDETIL